MERERGEREEREGGRRKREGGRGEREGGKGREGGRVELILCFCLISSRGCTCIYTL